MPPSYDCVVCGSCVVDVLVRPVALDRVIGPGKLVATEPLEITTGGIVSNSGMALSRLGMRVAVFSFVGADAWAEIIRHRYEAERIDTTHLLTHPTASTSTTAVLVDEQGERSFLHAVGAPRLLDKQVFLNHLKLFADSRAMLLGYYSLLPNLEADLPEVLAAIRATGCLTALDVSGDGGGMEPLDQCLPHLDFYVPSWNEAEHQTGEHDPRSILDVYRDAGAANLIGVKLGAEGALLSPRKGEFVEIKAVSPPGKVVDTTGAGDCFFGALLTGVLKGLSVKGAGQLAAAAGACCVTGLGASGALGDYDTTAQLAGLI